MKENFVHRTRIAPTPSGFLHLGNILSFAVTAALAEKMNASILLRIDDMDMNRAQPQYIRDIFDTLQFLDIPWHEGPRSHQEYISGYSQVHRMPLYEEALQQLKDMGVVFACSCSRTDIAATSVNGIYPGTCRHKNLPLNEKNVCWRLNTQDIGAITVKTLSGIITDQLPELLTDFIVRKKDGYPSYQLTSVIDDLYYRVDLIVRGNDLYPSTLAQLYLSSVLRKNAFSDIRFLHHPLLTEADGQKMSKSAGATSIQYLRGRGLLPGDIFQQCAEMAGFKTDIKDWRTLGTALLNKTVFV